MPPFTVPVSFMWANLTIFPVQLFCLKPRNKPSSETLKDLSTVELRQRPGFLFLFITIIIIFFSIRAGGQYTVEKRAEMLTQT